MMTRYDLMCGRSSKFTKLSGAAMAFEQASVACEIGWKKVPYKEVLDIGHNWSRIVSFDSCIIDYMVESTTREGVELIGWTYAGYVLDSIYKQDVASNTDNYVFLYEYLMCERRSSIVACTATT